MIDPFAGEQPHLTRRNPFRVEDHLACFPRVGEAPTLGY
jgi:hypothetical protein